MINISNYYTANCQHFHFRRFLTQGIVIGWWNELKLAKQNEDDTESN